MDLAPIALPKGVFIHEMPGAETLNQQILRDFLAHEHDKAIKRTHLFDGRYENIYVGTEQVPAMASIVEQACLAAKAFLRPSYPLRAGFWFNAMYPGHVTTVHSHDDDDECLSGVYYVTAPENSGNLILHTEEGLFTLPPRAGRFVFFPPEMPHEVSENQGTEFRLSVGMNFGPLSD
jgi:hypothetical protein